MQNKTSGTLYVIATPIGNLEDITFRAIKTLKQCSIILAEDTRSFGILKKQFDIETTATSFHDQNEVSKIQYAIDKLKNGEDVGLVSEAGTPLISDPGFKLVRECHQHNIKVSPLPGACSPIAALSASGLETDQFTFIGFLPNKDGKKRNLINDQLSLNNTVIFFESPYRVEKTLLMLCELAPNRPICVAKEITKIHEDIFTGKAEEVLEYLKINNKIKGEFCFIIGKEPKHKSEL